MILEDAELLNDFLVESQEHLADVENQLLTLEAQGDQMDVALVNTVFRAVHSIKGAAGFLGLETLGSLGSPRGGSAQPHAKRRVAANL